jgi:hypothetical protein
MSSGDVPCLMPSLKLCAARHELALGNTYVTKEGVAAPKSEVDPKVCGSSNLSLIDLLCREESLLLVMLYAR